MVRCSVLGCKSDSEKKIDGLSFHVFPDKPELLNLWMEATGRTSWVPKKSSRMCSKHFEKTLFMKKGNKTYLHTKAVPIKLVEGRVSASTSQQRDRDPLEPGSLSVAFVCKTCSKNITSFRYRCLVCPDYDMCGECEGRGGHHDDHYVLRVPMQRPTAEVDQVESAVRRALSSSTTWNKALKSSAKPTVEKKKLLKKAGNNTDKAGSSGDSRTDTGNDSDTEDALSDIERKPELTLHELRTTESRVAGSVDEPELKLEFFIKEEEDPLEEEAAESAFLQKIHEHQTTSGSKDVPSTQVVPSSHITQASQGDPWSYIVPLIHGAPQPQSVPPSQGVPPSKRRRGDEHRFTTTTHSHKTTPTTNETTELCTDTSSSSTVATSSKSESKVDVFVLRRRSSVDENYD